MAISQANKVVQHLRRTVLRHEGAGLTDGQLLACFLDHQEEEAFEALVRRHGCMVLGVCHRILKNAHDAEDAFQATFLVLVRKASSLSQRHTIGDWLYGVAYHTALKARAAAIRRREKERQVIEVSRPDARREEGWRDLQPLLDQELQRLPAKYREPVVLCDLEERTRKEAADQLGWPEGTVSSRLSRARVLLAKRLARHGFALSGGSLALLLTQHSAAASVPASLVMTTVKAGTLVTAGALTTGVISASAAVLMEGVLNAMFVNKVKTTLVVCLTLGLAGTGTGIVTHQVLAEKAVAQVVALAPDDAEQRRERPAADRPRLLPPGIERLELTAEQKEKIAKLEKESQEKLEAAKKKLDEAIEQAKQNQDRRKVQEAQEAFRKEVAPIHEAFHQKFVQVLTEEQRRRLDEITRRDRGGPPFDLPRILGQIDLNAEQKEKIEKLMKEFGEKQEAAKKKLAEAIEQAKQNQDRQKIRELLQAHEKDLATQHEELLKSVHGILTDEQKRRFAEVLQRRRPDGGQFGVGHILPPPLQERLGLSAEQREKLDRLQKEAEAKLREILNEEQNRKLDELKKGGTPERRRPQE